MEEFWKLKFGVEVSARYHEWRHGTMVAAQRFARTVTLIGAVATLLTALNPVGLASHTVERAVIVLSVIVACINLWELVSHLDEHALLHKELYRRFMALQSEMARLADQSEAHIRQWEGEVAIIRADEPPTMWAVYAMCWNQTAGRHYEAELPSHMRKVGPIFYFLRNIVQFRPDDFPPAASAKS